MQLVHCREDYWEFALRTRPYSSFIFPKLTNGVHWLGSDKFVFSSWPSNYNSNGRTEWTRRLSGSALAPSTSTTFSGTIRECFRDFIYFRQSTARGGNLGENVIRPGLRQNDSTLWSLTLGHLHSGDGCVTLHQQLTVTHTHTHTHT